MPAPYSEKTCTRCGETKSTSEFYKGSKRAHFRSRCKKCDIAVKTERYQQRKVGALPTSQVTEAFCPDCNQTKPATAFTVDHARPTGLKLYCQPCNLIRWRKSRYGLTDDEYRQMVERQAGCCAICLQPSKLVIDHCHGSGQVRGLLCDDCNVGLGRYGDDPERLMAAAAYLLQQANMLGEVR